MRTSSDSSLFCVLEYDGWPFVMPDKIIKKIGVASTILILWLCAAESHAQQQFVVGVLMDGPSDRLDYQHQKYIDELRVLTASEFDVEFRVFTGEWSKQSILAAIERAYADPEVDMVLATGFVTNQIAATRDSFPKPTFLPVIIDTGLLPQPPVDGVSGVRNLNYLSAYADFSQDLDTLARLLSFKKLVLFVDQNLSSAIPELRESVYQISAARGVELTEVTHDGIDHDLVARVPPDTDAVFVAGLPRMPATAFEELVESINAAGLASYSFAGVADVERGLLATNTEPRDIDRHARLNALNMQATMLGGRAAEQPVASNQREQLTINMATARRIGISPSFVVLSEAVLLNRDEDAGGQEYGLVDVARLALEQNQDLKSEYFAVQAGLREVARARSNLLPQLSLTSSYTVRKDSASVAAGLLPERSSDLALDASQVLYSDPVSANLTIQKELQRARESALHQVRLDVVQLATNAYYTVLNAGSQLRVQENNLRTTRANLELAEDRVRLGTSTAADVYRWQAEVARAQIGVVNARAALSQSWETLNRILHRPMGTRLALREASFDEPFVMSRESFDELVQNPADYAVFSRFYIDRALNQAPELQQLNAQVAAKQRELISQRRAYWLPDFSIGARTTDNLSQSGLGAGPQAGEGLNDWSVGVQATLPIFSGGQKRANVSRARFELRQLEALRVSTEERVEETVRNQLLAAQAAYAQIDLTAVAADASRKNFELVSDAYSRGAVTVIELLDAQSSSLTATAAASESLYNFLITIMSVQRAVGGFDFLLPESERDALANKMRISLSGSNR